MTDDMRSELGVFVDRYETALDPSQLLPKVRAILAKYPPAPTLGYAAILAALHDSSEAFSGIGEELGTSEVAILVEDAALVIANLTVTGPLTLGASSPTN